MRRLTMLAGLVAMGIASTASAQDEAPPAGEPSEKLGLPHEKYTLDNGLEVILHQDKRTPFVAVSVWYHVGAYHEPPGRSGFAHLFEHLMFQGSEHVGDDQHIAYLEQAGASVRGGMVNGTTNFDRTNYFEVLPRNELALALWLESDRMGYLGKAIGQETLDEQRNVVKNERLQGTENVPYGLAEETLWQKVFPSTHPYHGMVIGSLAELDAARVEDVRGFYDAYYAPSNATLCIAGDFETEEAKKLVKRYFSTLPRWDEPPKREVAPPVIEEPIELTYDEPIGKLAKVFILYLSPSFFAPGDADMDVLAQVLTSGKSSRLQRALLFKEQLAQSVRAYQYSLANVGVFGIEATVADGKDPKELLARIEAELELLQDLPPEQKEIDRVVNRIETERLFALQKIGGFSGKAEQLQSYNHFLGKPDALAEDLQRYRNVSPESLGKAVTTHLDRNRRAVLIAIPKENAPVENKETAATDAPAEKGGEG